MGNILERISALVSDVYMEHCFVILYVSKAYYQELEVWRCVDLHRFCCMDQEFSKLERLII